MTRTTTHFSWKCPYTFCEELLRSIHFYSFQSYAESIIDVVCGTMESLMISPHCIAYTSINVLMRYYYGLFCDLEPLPCMKLEEKEYHLCLRLIDSLYPKLGGVCKSLLCLSLSDEWVKRDRDESKNESEHKIRKVEKMDEIIPLTNKHCYCDEKKGQSVSPKNHTNQ